MKLFTKNKIYFVENNKKVQIKDKVMVEFSNYTKLLSRKKIDIFFRKFKLKPEILANDWTNYSNERMEITVVAKSEEDYYLNSEKNRENVSSFMDRVESISVTIHKPLQIDDVNILVDTMQEYRLNTYYIDENKHCVNRDELINFMSDNNLISLGK